MFGLENLNPEDLPKLASALTVEGNRQMKLYTAQVRKHAAKEIIQLFGEQGADTKVIKKVEAVLEKKNQQPDKVENKGLKLIFNRIS